VGDSPKPRLQVLLTAQASVMLPCPGRRSLNPWPRITGPLSWGKGHFNFYLQTSQGKNLKFCQSRLAY
jgi:hypothetical protein